MVIQIVKKLITIVNYFRTVPVYIAYKCSRQKNEIKMDIERWRNVTSDRTKPEIKDIATLNRLLMSYKEFRNLIQVRLKKPPFTWGSILSYGIARILWRPEKTLYINTYEIGGGLFIQHGFATVIDAERIGKNCWINQQVTIGYSGAKHPVIEDNVTILAGAKVIGGVTMHNNSTAGANAVVVKDVPENTIVGGVPAKIIKIKDVNNVV